MLTVGTEVWGWLERDLNMNLTIWLSVTHFDHKMNCNKIEEHMAGVNCLICNLNLLLSTYYYPLSGGNISSHHGKVHFPDEL